MGSYQALIQEQKKVAAEARAKIGEITDKTPPKMAKQIEEQFDKLLERHDQLEAEISGARDLEPVTPALRGRDGAVMAGERADDQHTRAFTNWLRSPLSKRTQSALEQVEQRSANSLTDAAGGYVVPEIIAGPLMSRARDANPLRDVVRVVNVSSGDVVFPLSNADATSGWVGETDARADTTEPTLAGKRPTFGVCYSYVKMTEEMAQDATIDVQDWFEREAGAALGEAEMLSIISGNGTNKPTGLLNTAPESGDDGSRTADAFKYLPAASATAFTVDECIDLVYDLKAKYRANGKWLMNSSTAGALRKLKTTDGAYLWQDAVVAGQPNTFSGYPVVICEGMQDVAANQHPIAFGDFSAGYILAQRSALSVTPDDNITEPGFVKLYIRHRIGGCVYDENAVRFLKMAAA